MNNDQNNIQTINDNPPTEALKEKCSRIRDMMCSADTRDARLRYKIGCQVCEAMDDEGKYGKGAVEYIAGEVGCTTANLYDYAAVAHAWTGDKFEETVKTTTSAGMALSFSHFVALAKVKPAERRPALLEECLTKSYSVRTLKDRIEETAPPAPSGATVHVLSPLQVVKKLVTASTACTEKVQTDIETLAELKELSTEQLVEQIKRAREEYAKARGLIEQVEARIAELLAKARKPSDKAA